MRKLAFGLYVLLTIALLIWGYYQAIYVAPNDARQGELSRIFYYHVPIAMDSSVFFVVSLAGSIGYLAYRHSRPERAQMFDAWALAGAEVAVVFCTIILVTGPIWGRRAWGMWWTWDARLTTTLVLWLIYVSYLLLRRFAEGSQMQTVAAVLNIFGALDTPIVYFSTHFQKVIPTQHPAPVFGGDADSGLKDPRMVAAWAWNILAWLAWGLLILAIRYCVERRQQKIVAAEARQALEA
jgi:heme exporter protein C